jgi:hypothetical protein
MGSKSETAASVGSTAGSAGSSSAAIGADKAGFTTDPVGNGADQAASAAPVAAGLESVGLVAGEADAARLAAELTAATAGIPAEPGTPGAASGAPSPAAIQWGGLTPFAVRVASDVVFPAWEIHPQEQKPIAEALAECLAQTFPNGIDSRFECWVKLAAACGAVAAARAAQPGGLPPLFRRKAAPAQAAQRDPMQLRTLTPDG